MYLVSLDPNRVVLGVQDLATLTPFTSLEGHLLSVLEAPQIGQMFDPDTQTFLDAPRHRWITKLAFDSRFSMAEAVALKVAQMTPTRNEGETDEAFNARVNVAAQLQVLQGRLNMASYIDLERSDTVQGVYALEQLGLLAVGRANEILTGPIAPHEYHPSA